MADEGSYYVPAQSKMADHCFYRHVYYPAGRRHDDERYVCRCERLQLTLCIVWRCADHGLHDVWLVWPCDQGNPMLAFYSAQMDRSFRWGMSWFYFSRRSCFFFAFFLALLFLISGSLPCPGWEGKVTGL